jgi:hypothetical protein
LTNYPAASFGLLQEVEKRGRQIKNLKEENIKLNTEIRKLMAGLGSGDRYKKDHVGFGRYRIIDLDSGNPLELPDGEWYKKHNIDTAVENMNAAHVNTKLEGE